MNNEAIKQYSLSGFSDAALNTQSILDVFVLQDIIDSEDAERLKANFKTNREVERFLLKNHLVSKETINKAYSIILKVPFIQLTNVEIPQEALSVIPRNLAIKFGIIAFDIRGKLVRLAVCNPADLLLNYNNGLAAVFAKKDLIIEIFITGQEDFNEAVKQYNPNKSNQLLLKRGSLPVIQLRNFKIAEKYIKKIPREFIEKYRIVVFEENVIGDYLIACEKPDTAITKKVLDYIEKENGVRLEVFATSKDDIDYVLESYEKKQPEAKADVVPVQQQPAQTQIAQPASSAQPVPAAQPVAPEAPKEKPSDKKEAEKNEKQKALFSFSLNKLFGENPSGKTEITIDSVVDQEREERTEDHKVQVHSVPVSEEGNENKQIESKQSNPVEAIDSKSPVNLTKPEEKKIDIHKVEENKTPSTQEGTVLADEKQKVSLGKDVMEAKDLGLLLDHEVINEQELEDVIKEGYVPKIVAAVLSYGLHKKVSDIHIEPQSKVLRIRVRMDGVLVDKIKMPLKLHPPIISRIKIISRLKIDETRIPQDGRFDVVLANREIDVRVSSLPTVHGEKIVLRVLDKSQKVLSLEDLGLQGAGFDKTIEAISKPWGIILSTGPTGSGKSTTLNAIINRLNTPGVNISTLEDPVEYETPGVNQTQVKPEIGFTFAAGLRSLLRQDPNIIMVGEIRDGETAGMATHAALTGHLVLSTLHTNDTAGTLPRLINMGIEPFLITSSMNLVIAQRLVRKVCPKCREEAQIPLKIVEEIKKDLEKISPKNIKDRERIPSQLKFYYGKGCNECTQGYKGRVGLFEVMSMSQEIEDLAINKRPANELKDAALRDGMLTMKQDGIIKALQGITTIDEVLQATTDK